MLLRWQFFLMLAIALIFALLTGYNIHAFGVNRDIQREIASGQQLAQRNAQFEALNNEIIQAVAELTVRDSDEDLRKLLATNGITVSVRPQTNREPPPAEAGSKGVRR